MRFADEVRSRLERNMITVRSLLINWQFRMTFKRTYWPIRREESVHDKIGIEEGGRVSNRHYWILCQLLGLSIGQCPCSS